MCPAWLSKKISRPLFTINFRPKIVFFDTNSILRVKMMYESVKSDVLSKKGTKLGDWQNWGTPQEFWCGLFLWKSSEILIGNYWALMIFIWIIFTVLVGISNKNQNKFQSHLIFRSEFLKNSRKRPLLTSWLTFLSILY